MIKQRDATAQNEHEGEDDMAGFYIHKFFIINILFLWLVSSFYPPYQGIVNMQRYEIFGRFASF